MQQEIIVETEPLSYWQKKAPRPNFSSAQCRKKQEALRYLDLALDTFPPLSTSSGYLCVLSRKI